MINIVSRRKTLTLSIHFIGNNTHLPKSKNIDEAEKHFAALYVTNQLECYEEARAIVKYANNCRASIEDIYLFNKRLYFQFMFAESDYNHFKENLHACVANSTARF